MKHCMRVTEDQCDLVDGIGMYGGCLFHMDGDIAEVCSSMGGIPGNMQLTCNDLAAMVSWSDAAPDPFTENEATCAKSSFLPKFEDEGRRLSGHVRKLGTCASQLSVKRDKFGRPRFARANPEEARRLTMSNNYSVAEVAIMMTNFAGCCFGSALCSEDIVEVGMTVAGLDYDKVMANPALANVIKQGYVSAVAEEFGVSKRDVKVKMEKGSVVMSAKIVTTAANFATV